MNHERIEKNVGLLVLSGMFIMVYNVARTIAAGSSARDVPVMAPAAA